jgi:putative selenate reductase
MAELRPYPFAALVRRMFRELDRNQAIFDLPLRYFVLGDPQRETSVTFHGRSASSPLGPAAGPQSQMAQNIVLSWLGGSRIFALKTVQVDDQLRIPRPCIDMRTIGYNVEWSQELRLPQSLEEYVKGSMLVQILTASEKLPLAPGFHKVIYDTSVGYDLAGVRSEGVQTFLRGMRDAKEVIDHLRGEIPAESSEFRDLDFETCISDSVTLSTFHGCPPHEIEGIIDFLLDQGFHCTIKFNPMLLGREETHHLLYDVLGYRKIKVPDSAFQRDISWDQAVEMMDRLGSKADGLGLGLGAKFTNTLVVENPREFLPDSEKEAYLSGPPLHLLAMHLVQRLRATFGDRFPISFSAGVDRFNFANAVALGLVPVTTCTDLLKTGGYQRLRGYDMELSKAMRKASANSIDDFILRAFGQGEAALRSLSLPPDATATCLEAFGGPGNPKDRVEPEVYERWVSAAKLLNTEVYVRKSLEDPRYKQSQNTKPPPKIGRHLQFFDCVTCDKCIPVCPNDANFTLIPPDSEIPVVKIQRRGSSWDFNREPNVALSERHQIANFTDFCNDCGNCDIFCPEDGGPYIIKPRFFGSEEGWREAPQLDGLFMERSTNGDMVLGRFEGREYRLDVASGRVSYSGKGFTLRFHEDDIEGTMEGDCAGETDLTYYYIMELLRRAVYDSRQVNYINSLVPEELES